MCIHPCGCVCVCLKFPSELLFFFSVHSFCRIFLHLIRLLFNRILPLSRTLPLCCHNDDFRVLQEEEYILLFYSQVKHTCYVNGTFWQCSIYHRVFLSSDFRNSLQTAKILHLFTVNSSWQSVEECVVIRPRLSPNTVKSIKWQKIVKKHLTAS